MNPKLKQIIHVFCEHSLVGKVKRLEEIPIVAEVVEKDKKPFSVLVVYFMRCYFTYDEIDTCKM
jgi:hypothetical protein